MKNLLIKNFLAPAIIILLLTSYAYGAGIGIRGGLNFSSVPSKTELTLPDGDGILQALPDSYTGFHFGVVGYFSLLNIFFQPELLYTQTGQDVMISFTENSEKADRYYTNTYSHLSIPALAGVNFGPLRVGLGPVGSLLLDSKHGWDDIEFDHNRFTIGFQAMAGVKLGNIMFDFKYEGSLSRLGDGVTVGGVPLDFDTRPRQFILSLGIILN